MLKYYYQLDGKGTPVPGSLVARRLMPANGTWKELSDYGCCTQHPVSAIITGDPALMAANDAMTYILKAGGHLLATATAVFDIQVANVVGELVSKLNTDYKALAAFSTSGIQIIAIPVAGISGSSWKATQVIEQH